jgi:hypothetical protein
MSSAECRIQPFHGLLALEAFDSDEQARASSPWYKPRHSAFSPLPLPLLPLGDTVPGLMLKHTPFYDFHLSAGGRMVDFAGWEMPIMYRSIIDEHEQTRKSGSIFDVSHMGRLYFSGADAMKFLDKVLTRKIVDQKVGQCRYSLVCNEAGGVMDDVIVSRDVRQWLVVCNASNREKLTKYFLDVRSRTGLDFDLSDQTEATAMVALQGPKVIDRVADLLPVDVRSMKRYTFAADSVMLIKFTVFRSGYTGEDGVELILPAKAASMAMKMLGGKFDKCDDQARGARRAGHVAAGGRNAVVWTRTHRKPGPDLGGAWLGGGSDQGFHRRRSAPRDPGKRPGAETCWARTGRKTHRTPGNADPIG